MLNSKGILKFAYETFEDRCDIFGHLGASISNLK